MAKAANGIETGAESCAEFSNFDVGFADVAESQKRRIAKRRSRKGGKARGRLANRSRPSTNEPHSRDWSLQD